MQVIKRDGRTEGVNLNKITNRIRLLCNDLSTVVDPVKISVETVRNINDMIKTTELDNISASIAEGHKMTHPDYSILASRIYVSNMHKSTPVTFSESLELIHEKLDSVRSSVFDFVRENKAAINAMIVDERDHNYGYLALLKLVQSYLDHTKQISTAPNTRERAGTQLLDRPQYMLMRCALALYHDYPCGLEKKLELIKVTYDDLSMQLYTHATPTLYNSSKREQQMLSCFPPDAQVATILGTKRIADVEIGDVVFTHNGTRCEVVQRHVNKLGDRKFVRVKIAGTPAFVCTEDHKFRVRDVDRMGQIVYKWRRAIDLTPANKMALVIDTRANHKQINWRNVVDVDGEYVNTHTRLYPITTPRIEDEVEVLNSIPINTDLFQLIASWLCADNTDPSRVVFKARTTDDLAVKRLISTIKKLFTVTPTVINVSDTHCLLAIYSGSLYNLLSQLFAPNDNYAFGMLSNGDIAQVYDQIAYLFGEPSLQTQRELFYLARARGMSCELTDDGQFIIPHEEYERGANGHRLYPVESVEIVTNNNYKIDGEAVTPDTDVYTLGVEDSHSYMINGVIAKNCFLLGVDDSIESIMDTVSKASKISKWSGGIGVHYSKIRARGQLIKGTNGRSSGIIPQLRIWDACASTWDQGGDKRKGSIAIYLEPWHADVCEFLELKLQNGADELRARNLFYAIWMNDLFMRRVEQDGDWSLFSEDTAPGLSTTYDSAENGFAFTRLYEQYEREGRAIRVMKAKDLRDRIITAQMETGVPYICYKDAANRKTNQSNIGTITGSNLCAEILEVCNAQSFACCTLASINVKKYLERLTYDDGKQITTEWRYNYRKLWEAARRIARNLDIIIDINSYPVVECVDNNSKYRPIGIGIQGLADLFCIMRIPYLSDLAAEIDVNITATIYHAALTESCARATVFGKYQGFDGSPASKGRLQYHMWGVDTPAMSTAPMHGYDDFKLDWNGLIADILARGLRNSLLVAYMPTASTSILLGNNESFEPYTSNIYSVNGLTGKQTTCNANMIYHLIELGLWTEAMSKIIGNSRGSIQGINGIPDNIKEIYKTVWELSQTRLLERSRARGAYIDQGESHNVFIEAPTAAKYRTIMRKGFELELKTGSYYIRTRPAAEAIKNNTLTATVSAAVAPMVAAAATTVVEAPVEVYEEIDMGPTCGRGGCSG
ncbi:ribonucleoside-diphosphate reductase large subunit [Faustovirus]|nr:ribonucleoside-diphosphate reductase large subunit [Faustovirus]